MIILFPCVLKQKEKIHNKNNMNEIRKIIFMLYIFSFIANLFNKLQWFIILLKRILTKIFYKLIQ